MIDLESTEAKRITKEMNSYLDGITIEDLMSVRRGRFYYEVKLSEIQCKQDIAVLDLKQRAYNCLRRSGYNTIGCILDHCHDKEEESSKKQLLKIHNLGKGTADEILLKLFLYQFSVLPEEKKKQYMKTIVEMNNRA